MVTPLLEAFRIANDVLKQAIQGISDIIQISGLINADFAADCLSSISFETSNLTLTQVFRRAILYVALHRCIDTQIMHKETDMQEEASLFKVLADPTRLRLATLLAIQGETCVCMLADALNEPDFKISRHLGIMRSSGMVEARREGTWMYYKLSGPRYRLEQCLQDCFRDCLADNKTVKADTKRLKNALKNAMCVK